MNGNDNIDDTNNDNVTTITILDKDVNKIAQNKNNNTTATTTVEAGGNNNNNPTRRFPKKDLKKAIKKMLMKNN